MNKRILVGIDAPISPATQHALRSLSAWLEEASPRLSVVLLHIVPVPVLASPAPGFYSGHLHSPTMSNEQRQEGEIALRRARTELQNRGLSPERIEVMLRIGAPAEEIVKVAKELEVDQIMVGSRGNTFRQRMRRVFAGSVSRRVLALAPYPVTIVSPLPPLRLRRPHDLVSWYEEAITRYLQEHTGDLAVFTPQEVALAFAPPGKHGPGRKEHAAAILALEHLARDGILCRHDVKGQMRYVND
jgi:nucleotide-binding universal stress UspA family protein